MANPLPVKMGISSGAVRNIPTEWSAEWFRRFITHHMQNMDIRNTIAGTGITITGTEQQPGTISAGSAAVATANLPATPFAGARSMVSDATSTTFGSVLVGGGTNIVPVYYDGVSHWRIG